jgi:tRNA 2-thiouridine synthesizing protein A
MTDPIPAAGAIPAADVEIDATGLVCPEPLMLVRNRVREMRSGEVLRVVATDPSTGRDFRDFCRFMGHALVADRRDGGTFEYWIRKG